MSYKVPNNFQQINRLIRFIFKKTIVYEAVFQEMMKILKNTFSILTNGIKFLEFKTLNYFYEKHWKAF